MLSLYRYVQLTLVAVALTVGGCSFLKIDQNSVFLRSDIITSPEEEAKVLAKARTSWTADRRIRVLYVSGTAYERGYQHGVLLRNEVRTNLMALWNGALKKFHNEELFAESYERMRPFIPQEYVDEMQGLAHGSKLPLSIIHGIHALPEMGEWGGRKQLKKIAQRMMDGTLGTSCSNFCASGSATKDGKMYTVRILDWGLHRISKLHEYPLITVSKPDQGIPSANIGWVGFLGAVSGMNAKGITLGEMGYGDPPNETMRGFPMPFLLRHVMSYTSSLAEVRKMIKESIGTNSFVYLMSDGKTKESELYIKDRERFLLFEPGSLVADRNKSYPIIPGYLYGGHYQDKMTSLLTEYKGEMTPDIIMSKVIPGMVMPSNFQNVLYAPEDLQFWVANAASVDDRAAEGKYTFFDLKAALAE